MTGYVDLILCPAAVILAVIALIRRNKKCSIFVILSYVCCSLPSVLSLYDIVNRVNCDDIGGILDIYPTMSIVYIVVIGIVTVLNLCAALKKE